MIESDSALFRAFPPVSDKDWLSRIEKDLQGGPLPEWALPGGPTVLPFYRRAEPVRLASARSGWTMADLLPSDAALGEHLRRSRDGGSGLALIDVEPMGLGQVLAVLNQVGGSEPVWVIVQGPEAVRQLPARTPGGAVSVLWDPVAALLEASLAADPLKHAASDGAQFGGSATAVKEAGWDVATDRASKVPGEILVDLRAWSAAGAPPAWLAAAAFGSASEWLAACGHRASERLRFIIPAATSYFPAISLLRAIRSGLEQLFGLYGATDVAPRLLAMTDPGSLTRTDEYGNLLRCTTSAMAAVIGAADAVCVLPFDLHSEASERGRRLSRNISHLLREESHLGRVADPSHGAWYIEELTRGIGTVAWDLFKDWEAQGGLLSCLSAGGIQRQLSSFREEEERRVRDGERILVGVNRFEEEGHAS